MIVGLSVLGFVKNYSISAVVNSDRANANQLIRQIQNELRDQPFNTVPDNSPYTWTRQKFNATATVGAIDSENVANVDVVVTWPDHRGQTKTLTSSFKLTDEGDDDQASGKIWAEALDADNNQGIPGYMFCAVPHVLQVNPDISYRVLARTCIETDANGKAFFKNLQQGTWFIIPMGRPGDYLSGLMPDIPEPYLGTWNPADEAYPAVVRHYDYDFLDESFATGNNWQTDHAKRKEVAAAYSTQNMDNYVPSGNLPYPNTLFEVEEGKTYNEEHPQSEWDKPNNEDGTLVFRIKKAGSIGGIVGLASPDLTTYTGGDYGIPYLESLPQAYYVGLPGYTDRNTIIAEELLSTTLVPFKLNLSTYLGQEYYGIMFGNTAKHMRTPPFPEGNLNKQYAYPAPTSPFFRRKASPTGGPAGHWIIRASHGALAQPAGYGTKLYKPTSYTPGGLALTVTLPFTGPGGVLKNHVLVNGYVQNTFDYAFHNLLLPAGQHVQYDWVLVPIEALADITLVNDQGLDFKVDYTGYDTTNGVLTYQTVSGTGGTVTTVPYKNVIPSGSGADLKTFTATPTTLVIAGTPKHINLTGTVDQIDFGFPRYRVPWSNGTLTMNIPDAVGSSTFSFTPNPISANPNVRVDQTYIPKVFTEYIQPNAHTTFPSFNFDTDDATSAYAIFSHGVYIDEEYSHAIKKSGLTWTVDTITMIKKFTAHVTVRVTHGGGNIVFPGAGVQVLSSKGGLAPVDLGVTDANGEAAGYVDFYLTSTGRDVMAIVTDGCVTTPGIEGSITSLTTTNLIIVDNMWTCGPGSSSSSSSSSGSSSSSSSSSTSSSSSSTGPCCPIGVVGCSGPPC
ncbi:MAG: hypothetical protein KCHDKBKB_00401 [Elusimicrobia bacterium]|nr:hypothetical protein [Elusimicrobiota bacterium]